MYQPVRKNQAPTIRLQARGISPAPAALPAVARPMADRLRIPGFPVRENGNVYQDQLQIVGQAGAQMR